MSSYWADAPYRQRAKPVAPMVTPPTVKAPGLPGLGGVSSGYGSQGIEGPGGLTGLTGLAGGYGGMPNMPNIPGIDPGVLGQAWGVINPQLQSIADIINRRSQFGAGAISGLTGALQNDMGQVSGMVSSAYGPEIKQARATAGWAGDSLTGAGAAQGAGLNAMLTQTGGSQGAIAGSSDLNLKQEGKGAGGAAYGTGIAELDNLIAQRAASQTRAALEPSFAAMTGQQQQGMLAAQLARQLADQQSTVMASLPQLLLDLQGRADTKASDQRDYEERVREFNSQQNAAKAQVVSATAPTLAGRKAYFDKLAADRTAQDSQGRVWVGTTSGIRPATDPKTGKPLKSTDWQKTQITTILSTGLDANGALTPEAKKKLAGLGVLTGGGASESTVKTNISAATSLTNEATRHQDAMDRNRIALQNANTAQDRAAVMAKNAAENKRHHTWVEQHPGALAEGDKPMGTPTGTAPRRTKSGVWHTAAGKLLDLKGQLYWERQYNIHNADGRGRWQKGGLKKAGSTSTAIPPSQATKTP